jgi:uncharacterized protein YkwD
MVVLALCGIIAAVALGGVSGDLSGSSGFDAAAAEQAAHERVNEARQANGLPPLPESTELVDFSREWSGEMAASDELEHSDVACEGGGENIAFADIGGKTSAEVGVEIAEGWLDSPGHRENIMRGQWQTTGIGMVNDGGRVYAAQQFCG